MQACLDKALGAKQYYSDAFPIYGTLYYGAPFELREDKKETYSVEAVNADLRHYLKRLARKSRIFLSKDASTQKEHSVIRFLLQSKTDHEKKFPKVFLPPDQLFMYANLGTLFCCRL